MLFRSDTTLLASAAAMVLLVAPMAQAETLNFHADMTPGAELPPTESDATGTADFSVDTDSHKISWTVSVDGLTGDPTAAHVHGPASATENAPPEISMSDSMMDGSADITDDQLSDMKDGMTYVNVHTAKYPDGEIRGQIAAAQ